MNVSIDGQMQKFIDEKVASGEYASPKDVLQAALAILQLQESFGDFEPGELERLIAEGERSIVEQGVIPGDEGFARLRKRYGDGNKTWGPLFFRGKPNRT